MTDPKIKTAQIDGLLSISISLNCQKSASKAALRQKIVEVVKQALADIPECDGEPYCDEYQSLDVEFE